MGRLVAYSCFIPEEHYKRLKAAAKERKAASLVRDGLTMILENQSAFDAGYNTAIKDAMKVVYDCPEAQMVAVSGKDLGAHLKNQLEMLIKV
jgi:hypothetical protein